MKSSFACRFGYHDQLAQAFTAGVSPDIRDDKGYTLLMQSSMNGNMRCMKVISHLAFSSFAHRMAVASWI
jgi:hypothetical protein